MGIVRAKIKAGPPSVPAPGPGAAPAFHAAYFATRVIFPGALMSAVFFVVDPAFIIAAHCAAHFGIAFLF